MSPSRPEEAPSRPEPRRFTWEEYERWIAERKRGRWARILAAEPPGRVPGRRPRDPSKEEILARLDRRRLAGGE